MECREIQKQLIFYIEKELPQGIYEKITLHLENCPDCFRLFNLVEASYKSDEKNKVIDINPFFYTQLKQKIKNKSEKEKVIFSGNLLQKIWIPTMIIIITIASYLFLTTGNRKSIKESEQISLNTRTVQLQYLANEYYLNDLAEEHLESTLLTENQ